MKEEIINEILEIMDEYHRQEKEFGWVDTPGGLEHMGDVWELFKGWERRLRIYKE